MPCTPAQLAANRANALKSTGPQTAEGKEASRQNALKHGLTGQAVVIPAEDYFEVAQRIETFQAEMAIDGSAMSRALVQRLAALTVRAERSVRHELAMTAERVRFAAENFDEARRAEATHLLDYIAQDPTTNHRRLMAMPEGVDLLIELMRKLRIAAQRQPCMNWDDLHRIQFDFCTGWRSGTVPASRCAVLSRASIYADFSGIDPSEIAGLTPLQQVEWAQDQIVALIDAEIARLEAHRPTLDHAKIAESRAEAPARALVDTGPAANLARKYEAITDLAIHRTLRSLNTLRKEHGTKLEDPVAVAAAMAANTEHLAELAEIDPPLGSFFPSLGDATPPIDASMITIGKTPAAPQTLGSGVGKSPGLT